MTRLRFILASLIILTGCASYSAQVRATKEMSPVVQKQQAVLALNEMSPTIQAQQKKAALSPNEKLIAAAIEQVGVTTTYDPAYTKLMYPNGDVPPQTGVCADVIVRSFRKVELDLQKALHEDMKANFAKYPKKWGLKAPDRNIDHRRVPNLMTWFERQNKTIPLSKKAEDYLPGDVVAWDLGGGLTHIGIVSDIKQDKNYSIVHNIGAGTQIEDRLFDWKIIGHYRFFTSQINQ